jgi:hypothetical protein
MASMIWLQHALVTCSTCALYMYARTSVVQISVQSPGFGIVIRCLHVHVYTQCNSSFAYCACFIYMGSSVMIWLLSVYLGASKFSSLLFSAIQAMSPGAAALKMWAPSGWSYKAYNLDLRFCWNLLTGWINLHVQKWSHRLGADGDDVATRGLSIVFLASLLTTLQTSFGC